VVWFAATGRAYLQLGTLHRPLIQFVIVIFLITTSACHHAVRTISSLYLSVGRSWVDYCWDSLPSLYTFQKTYTLSGLARYCLQKKSSTEFIRYGQIIFYSYSYNRLLNKCRMSNIPLHTNSLYIRNFPNCTQLQKILQLNLLKSFSYPYDYITLFI